MAEGGIERRKPGMEGGGAGGVSVIGLMIPDWSVWRGFFGFSGHGRQGIENRKAKVENRKGASLDMRRGLRPKLSRRDESPVKGRPLTCDADFVRSCRCTTSRLSRAGGEDGGFSSSSSRRQLEIP